MSIRHHQARGDCSLPRARRRAPRSPRVLKHKGDGATQNARHRMFTRRPHEPAPNGTNSSLESARGSVLGVNRVRLAQLSSGEIALWAHRRISTARVAAGTRSHRSPSETVGMSTVSALIRRGDTVLLVRHQASHDEAHPWYLPGGVVEPGEHLHHALLREVREETGLTITGLSPGRESSPGGGRRLGREIVLRV